MISNGIRSIVVCLAVLAILYLPGSVIDSKAASAVEKNSFSSRQQMNKSFHFATLKYGSYFTNSIVFSMDDTLANETCGSRLIRGKSEDLSRNPTRAESIGLTACHGCDNNQRHFFASGMFSHIRVSEIWAFHFGRKPSKYYGDSQKAEVLVSAWQGSQRKTA